MWRAPGRLKMMAAMISVPGRPWSRALSSGGIAILILIEITTIQTSNQRGETRLAIVAVTLVVAGSWTILIGRVQRDRRSLLGPVLLVILGAGSIALALLSPQGAAIIGVIVSLAAAANRFDLRTGVAYAIVLIAAFLVAIASRVGFQPIILLSYGLGLAFAFIATRSVAQLREEQARTQALLNEVQASRDAQIQSAALNERARIAREIHDVLAHTLAALAVQLEGARLMLQRRDGDPEALASVERAHRLAREGLEETRRAVSALRGDRIPGPAELAQLVKDFARDSGTEAILTVDGDPRSLPSEAQLALYRTAQEALTNVRKHAQPQHVNVVLRYRPDGTELEVVDAAAGNRLEPSPQAEGQLPESGYGLMGMRERAELLGGSLEAEPTEDGFRVRLWIPA
jgi:signal transduction histidine kinase